MSIRFHIAIRVVTAIAIGSWSTLPLLLSSIGGGAREASRSCSFPTMLPLRATLACSRPPGLSLRSGFTASPRLASLILLICFFSPVCSLLAMFDSKYHQSTIKSTVRRMWLQGQTTLALADLYILVSVLSPIICQRTGQKFYQEAFFTPGSSPALAFRRNWYCAWIELHERDTTQQADSPCTAQTRS